MFLPTSLGSASHPGDCCYGLGRGNRSSGEMPNEVTPTCRPVSLPEAGGQRGGWRKGTKEANPRPKPTARPHDPTHQPAKRASETARDERGGQREQICAKWDRNGRRGMHTKYPNLARYAKLNQRGWVYFFVARSPRTKASACNTTTEHLFLRSVART